MPSGSTKVSRYEVPLSPPSPSLTWGSPQMRVFCLPVLVVDDDFVALHLDGPAAGRNHNRTVGVLEEGAPLGS